MSAAPLLQVDGLRMHFFTKAGVVKAVDDVSFSVGRGEILGLVGESGSGKSMTGYSILGPEGFDLDGYIQSGEFSAPQGEGTLRLEARFDPGCALHLREAHLSADQTLEDEPDGRVRLTATVPDTGELRWWLLGFGDGVELVGPEALRAEFAAIAQALADTYR